MDNYYLSSDEGKWKLHRQGGQRAVDVFDNKADAVKDSAAYVREHGGSLKIKKKDGQIQEERTYPRSADPKKSPG
jgi:hypothetical protein